MSASDWATIIYSYVFVLGAVLSVVWYLFKHGADKVIDAHLLKVKESLSEELTVVKEMDKRLDRIEYALYNDGKTGLVNKVDQLIENQNTIKLDVEILKVKAEA